VLKVIVSRVDAYKRQIDFVPIGSPAPAAEVGQREVGQRPPEGQRPGQKVQRGQRPGFGRKKEAASRRRRRWAQLDLSLSAA